MIALLTIALISFSCSPIATALRCDSGSDLNYQSYECPLPTTQCFKFVCNENSGRQGFVNRGCSLPQACQANTDTCRSAGGFGQCFLCSDRDNCNGARAMTGSLAAITLSLLLIIPFLVR